MPDQVFQNFREWIHVQAFIVLIIGVYVLLDLQKSLIGQTLDLTLFQEMMKENKLGCLYNSSNLATSSRFPKFENETSVSHFFLFLFCPSCLLTSRSFALKMRCKKDEIGRSLDSWHHSKKTLTAWACQAVFCCCWLIEKLLQQLLRARE